MRPQVIFIVPHIAISLLIVFQQVFAPYLDSFKRSQNQDLFLTSIGLMLWLAFFVCCDSQNQKCSTWKEFDPNFWFLSPQGIGLNALLVEGCQSLSLRKPYI